MKNKIFVTLIMLLLVGTILTGCDMYAPTKSEGLIKFKSGSELVKALEDAKKSSSGGRYAMMESATLGQAMPKATSSISSDSSSSSYSTTNIQVAGVDEADIIKTDGIYIYALANNKLIISRAYPSGKAEILSTTKLNNFYPQEFFIEDDKLLLFGSANYNYLGTSDSSGSSPDAPIGTIVEPEVTTISNKASFAPVPRYIGMMSARLYDVSDKKNPEVLRIVDFEGNYLTSRKIGSDVYFVVNSYPNYYSQTPGCEEVVPLYRENTKDEKPQKEDLKPIVKCTDIGYVNPIQASNFITLAAISMEDETQDVEKEVIVGSGQNVYASLDNLYVAQTSWPRYSLLGELKKDYQEKTVITKFKLDKGSIEFGGTGEVNGHILNQFSMDEYKDSFRIATTIGSTFRSNSENSLSTNNVYILDKDLKVTGKVEDLAPGEKIYSVRFMGKRGYVVTFKKVDPLFVLDLENPQKPSVLGKLKIPGYSDYLHPYDENHLIGIGKDAVESEKGDFAWYLGVKMAIFDVSDVSNPKELHKVEIGDRGTDSPALHDHKAFLFDKKKNLLVIPITLAEIKGVKTSDHQYGEYTFQGAYIYDLTLKKGFDLKGKITHYDDNQTYLKSGYYFSGSSSIKRSLYIDDVLYTLSDNRLQLNDLDNLKRLKILDFE